MISPFHFPGEKDGAFPRTGSVIVWIIERSSSLNRELQGNGEFCLLFISSEFHHSSIPTNHFLDHSYYEIQVILPFKGSALHFSPEGPRRFLTPCKKQDDLYIPPPFPEPGLFRRWLLKNEGSG